MFDISKIRFMNDTERGYDTYSFVGLQKNKKTGELEFWLPLGFDDFPKHFEGTKKFFFQIYRTFQIYRDRKLANNQDSLKEFLTNDRDGIFEQKEGGFSFINNKDNTETVFYGKLNALDKILQGYDELRIASLEKKQVRSHQIDYSKIYKYMHQAVFLEGDVIYLDEMNISKNIILQESPTIVQMFCFIYTEIKTELEEIDSVANRVLELSDQFKEKHLHPQGGLFAEDTFADTIETLKILLDEIETKTTYKDEDFWHFYEAVEAFLYGEKQDDNTGIYFGISSFADVWEDMCQSYMLAQSEIQETVLFADVDGFLKNRKHLGLPEILPKNETDLNPFVLKMDNSQKERYLRPDLVAIQRSKSESQVFEYKQLPHLKQGQKAYGVTLLDYEALKSTNPAIIKAYNQLKIVEPHNSIPGARFKYMPQQNLEEFKKIVLKEIQNRNIIVIDYKYLRLSDYAKYNSNAIDAKGENKIKSDIHKQLIYEWTLQQNFENAKTSSKFWIPYYSKNMDFTQSTKDITNRCSSDFHKSRIEVFQINFKILQEHYVKLST